MTVFFCFSIEVKKRQVDKIVVQKIPAIIAVEAGRDKIYEEEMEGLGFVASKRSESKKNGSPRNGGVRSVQNPVNDSGGVLPSSSLSLVASMS